MRDARLYQRLPFDGEGRLTLQEGQAEVTTINISKGGACLRVDKSCWFQIEALDQISGVLGIDGSDFNFNGRICWSSTNGERVHFGVEFLDCDRDLINQVLERMSIVENTDGGDPFII